MRRSNIALVNQIAAGSGILGVQIENQSVPLATLATNLNFVGDSLAVTGAGGSKTITSIGLIGYNLDAKPSGNGMPGFPIDWRHNDASGYLLHLASGATMSGTSALLGIGIGDSNNHNAVVGVLVSNKLDGVGVQIQNASTIEATNAYGIYGIQQSTLAPMVFLQETVTGSAPALQLGDNSPAAVAGQMLVDIYSVNGGVAGFANRIGQVFADTGRLDWYKDIRANGSTLIASTSDHTVGPTGDVDQARVSAAAIGFHVFTGSTGLFYPWRIAGSGESLLFQEGGDFAAIGSEAWATVIELFHGSGVNKIGLFGAAPVAQQTGVAVTVAAIWTALAAYGLITA